MAKAENAKTIPKYSKGRGPYLTTAVIAEKVLLEPDGATTIVRIVDRVGLNLAENVNPRGVLIGINLTVLTAFRAGGFKGKANAQIVQISPSGKTVAVGMSEMQFDGSASATINVQAQVVILWEGEGAYWFDILLNDKLVTRIPLNVELGNLLPQKKTKKNR